MVSRQAPFASEMSLSGLQPLRLENRFLALGETSEVGTRLEDLHGGDSKREGLGSGDALRGAVGDAHRFLILMDIVRLLGSLVTFLWIALGLLGTW